VVHGSTFSKNDLAMAAGIATLDVMKAERITENAALMGERLLRELSALTERYELLKEVRGKGLMIGIEFGAPASFKLKASWAMLGDRQQGPVLPARHHSAVQGAQDFDAGGRSCSHTIKLIPTLVINEDDCDWIVRAFDDVIADAHSAGAVWTLGKNLVEHAMRA
jgi:ornithine--oxo-acid transaminase